VNEWKEDNRFPFASLFLLPQISTKLVFEKIFLFFLLLILGCDGIGSCRETSEVSADQLRPLLSQEFSIKYHAAFFFISSLNSMYLSQSGPIHHIPFAPPILINYTLPLNFLNFIFKSISPLHRYNSLLLVFDHKHFLIIIFKL